MQNASKPSLLGALLGSWYMGAGLLLLAGLCMFPYQLRLGYYLLAALYLYPLRSLLSRLSVLGFIGGGFASGMITCMATILFFLGGALSIKVNEFFLHQRPRPDSWDTFEVGVFSFFFFCGHLVMMEGFVIANALFGPFQLFQLKQAAPMKPPEEDLGEKTGWDEGRKK